ncbi:MAG TPA: RdgB/HAM1 family non-canonical purine NTP pyrophosphatase [Steroidobacteraceae bacterium]
MVLASSNAGKLRELTALLAPLDFELIPQGALGVTAPHETGDTFRENAMLKARYASALTTLPALADDSGIEVDFLGGRPGVFSARYAGEHATDRDNLDRMLQELEPAAPPERTARYRCVIVFLRHGTDPAPVIAEGSWEGSILRQPRGAGGFGYDPIFLPAGLDRSAAELSPEQKNALSHRGAALSRLLARLVAERS